MESIPVSATREWLQRVFSEYGPVAYISLPTFKNSKTIKVIVYLNDSYLLLAAHTNKDHRQIFTVLQFS